jgi:hypothetical protein
LFVRWDKLSIVSIIAIPLYGVSVAIVGKSTFWFDSSSFYSQLPTYLVLLLILEATQLAAILLARGAWNPSRLTSPDARLVLWGACQVLIGSLLIHAFSDNDLWLGSVAIVYAGLAAGIVAALSRIRRLEA